MAFQSKFNKVNESFVDMYYRYYTDEDFQNNGNPNQPKLKEGDTINVLLISDKGLRDGEKSDTARNYLVTKIDADAVKMELTPKEPIKQLNIKTGEMEDYLGDVLKVDLAKQKGRLIATGNPGVWMLELTVDGEPLFKKETDEIEQTDKNKTPVNDYINPIGAGVKK